MVWGMDIPSSFGEFWPEGDFEGVDERGSRGWSKRLIAYYEENMQEAQKALFDDGCGNGALRYMGHVFGKFTHELGTCDEPDSLPLTPIEDHEPPTSFDTDKGYTSLGSLIALNYGVLAVNEALKAIIERVEPVKHQFFPIEIKMPKGKVFPERYYILVIGQYIGSFSPADSRKESWQEPVSGRYSHDESKKGVAGLALSKVVFGKAHLWRERGFLGLLTCLSDELEREIAKAGLRIPKHYQMKEA
ncbi:MAG: DUF1629 domain-containing protein [Sphingomonas bacterium]